MNRKALQRTSCIVIFMLLLSITPVFGVNNETPPPAQSFPQTKNLNNTQNQENINAIVIDGYVMVPIISTFNNIGIKNSMWITGDAIVGVVDIFPVKLTLGSKSIYIAGNERVLDIAPTMVNETVFIHIGFIEEIIQCSVSLDLSTKTIVIESKYNANTIIKITEGDESLVDAITEDFIPVSHVERNEPEIILTEEQVKLFEEAKSIIKRTGKAGSLSFDQYEAVMAAIYPEALNYLDLDGLYFWIENVEDIKALKHFQLVLHEEYHVYSFVEAFERNRKMTDLERCADSWAILFNINSRNLRYRYRIDNKEYIVKSTSVSKGEEYLRLIPSSARNDFTRYYIKNDGALANNHGIYGIISEYNSYVREIDFILSYSEHFNLSNNQRREIYYYEKPFIEEMEAYMIAALLHAEKTNPSEFESLMENVNLRIVYSRLTDMSEELFNELYPEGNDCPNTKLLETKKFKEMEERFYLPREANTASSFFYFNGIQNYKIA